LTALAAAFVAGAAFFTGAFFTGAFLAGAAFLPADAATDLPADFPATPPRPVAAMSPLSDLLVDHR
jgi:hypothetical protein